MGVAFRASVLVALGGLGLALAIGCGSSGSAGDAGEGDGTAGDTSAGGSSGGSSSGGASSGGTSSGGVGADGAADSTVDGATSPDASVDGTAGPDSSEASADGALPDADASLVPETSSGTDAGTDASDAASSCPGGKHTTISGRVYDPANVNPVYGAAVYVPAGALSTLPTTPSCGTCDDLYSSPVASTLTDPGGYFRLVDPPSGTVDLVVQIGKWRMSYPAVTVTACQDNPQPDHSLRLPRNHGEGDLPQMAFVTGAADSIECVPLRMGVDSSEYVVGAGPPGGGGHIHIFTAAGGVAGAALPDGGVDPRSWLWDKGSDIAPYDVVVFGCEGSEPAGLSLAGQQVLFTYVQNGGRVFATHFEYAWFNTGPFSTMVSPALASWTTGTNIDNDPIGGIPTKTFPQGQAFSGWLADAGALYDGSVEIHYGRENAQVGTANTLSQTWVTADSTSLKPGGAQLFSFDTPFDAGAPSCGRVFYSDIHATGGPNNASDPSTDYPGFSPGIVPAGCASRSLTAQEKVIEYAIFDLGSCLTPIGQTPQPPRVP